MQSIGGAGHTACTSTPPAQRHCFHAVLRAYTRVSSPARADHVEVRRQACARMALAPDGEGILLLLRLFTGQGCLPECPMAWSAGRCRLAEGRNCRAPPGRPACPNNSLWRVAVAHPVLRQHRTPWPRRAVEAGQGARARGRVAAAHPPIWHVVRRSPLLVALPRKGPATHLADQGAQLLRTVNVRVVGVKLLLGADKAQSLAALVAGLLRAPVVPAIRHGRRSRHRRRRRRRRPARCDDLLSDPGGRPSHSLHSLWTPHADVDEAPWHEGVHDHLSRAVELCLADLDILWQGPAVRTDLSGIVRAVLLRVRLPLEQGRLWREEQLAFWDLRAPVPQEVSLGVVVRVPIRRPAVPVLAGLPPHGDVGVHGGTVPVVPSRPCQLHLDVPWQCDGT
mmetsp:Transcript_89665/g.267431  ORF Transcript_89665/g.267431 Transcript_89665/m.267431 type:complete len:394 (+) Transcript_89665:176-1357(+)